MASHIKIGDISPRIQYTSDGVQAAFTYPFPIFENVDLEVYADAALQSTGLTITGAGDSAGGLVTFDTAPVSGMIITLARRLNIQRTSDFQESGEFRSKVINDELDYLTASLQQVSDDQSRSLQMSITESKNVDTTLPTPVANMSIVWNDTESGFVNGPTSDEITSAQSYATSASASSVAAATSAGQAATSDSNAAASAASASANANAAGTSTTSIAIGTGSHVFTTQTGKFFEAGNWMLIISDADPSNFMHGYSTAYSGTDLTFQATNIGGSGIFTDWTIRLSGTQGALGPTGATGQPQWQGAWLTATVYAVNDSVESGGSSYICLTAHTSGTFSTDLAAAKWELIAQKGTDGINGDGAGDVIGPASATASSLAMFSDATGKLLKDGAVIGADVQAFNADTIVVPPGTSGNILTSNGTAWTSAAAAGGGSWTVIASKTSTGDDPSLDITGLDATYAMYAFACTDFVPISAGAHLVLRFGDSGGFDSGVSDYGYHLSLTTDVGAAYIGLAHATRAHIHIAGSVNTGTDSCSVTGFISGGFDGTNLCYVHGTHVNENTGADFSGGQFFGGRLAVITTDRVQVLFDTGNISAGRFTVWGLKHA